MITCKDLEAFVKSLILFYSLDVREVSDRESMMLPILG
jgi:hypothetical protein